MLQINIVQQILVILEGLLPSMKLGVEEEEEGSKFGKKSYNRWVVYHTNIFFYLSPLLQAKSGG